MGEAAYLASPVDNLLALVTIKPDNSKDSEEGFI